MLSSPLYFIASLIVINIVILKPSLSIALALIVAAYPVGFATTCHQGN